jgi:hypothetical protein
MNRNLVNRIVDCPYCRRKLRLAETLSKRIFKCPSCGGRFRAEYNTSGAIEVLLEQEDKSQQARGAIEQSATTAESKAQRVIHGITAVGGGMLVTAMLLIAFGLVWMVKDGLLLASFLVAGGLALVLIGVLSDWMTDRLLR